MDFHFIQWTLTISVPFIFVFWSFLSNSSGFSNALSARIALLIANAGGYTKAIGTSIAGFLYVVFDPFWIIIDDVIVIGVTVFIVRNILKGIVRDNFPFPLPWTYNLSNRLISLFLIIAWAISILTLIF
ncbi:MAG: hypothetical protein SFU99_21090 [Saprospiraceae bacterium]|nr:hypothetical protein [Saprospiraceae bacterium]